MTRDEIIAMLKTGVFNEKFTTGTGVVRVMAATLKEDLLPPRPPVDPDKPVKPRKENLDVIPVYDLEAYGWRSFRVDRVIDITEGV